MAPVSGSASGEIASQDFIQSSPVLFYFIVSVLGLAVAISCGYMLSLLVAHLQHKANAKLLAALPVNASPGLTYTSLFNFDRLVRRAERRRFQHQIEKNDRWLADIRLMVEKARHGEQPKPTSFGSFKSLLWRLHPIRNHGEDVKVADTRIRNVSLSSADNPANRARTSECISSLPLSPPLISRPTPCVVRGTVVFCEPSASISQSPVLNITSGIDDNLQMNTEDVEMFAQIEGTEERASHSYFSDDSDSEESQASTSLSETPSLLSDDALSEPSTELTIPSITIDACDDAYISIFPSSTTSSLASLAYAASSLSVLSISPTVPQDEYLVVPALDFFGRAVPTPRKQRSTAQLHVPSPLISKNFEAPRRAPKSPVSAALMERTRGNGNTPVAAPAPVRRIRPGPTPPLRGPAPIGPLPAPPVSETSILGPDDTFADGTGIQASLVATCQPPGLVHDNAPAIPWF